jgi:hypothetical protein
MRYSLDPTCRARRTPAESNPNPRKESPVPRKRPKPAAPTDTTQTPTELTAAPLPDRGSADQPAPSEPDVFDRAAAARKAGQFELPEPPAETPPDTAGRIETAMRVAPVVRASDLAAPDDTAPRSRPRAFGVALPDPRSIDQISLDADPAGPKMRLLRSRRGEVWIQFDANPGREATDPIKAEGFRWEPRAEVNGRPGAWVKRLEPGREVRTMLDAERLFRDTGNRVRGQKGLDPVGELGPGAS